MLYYRSRQDFFAEPGPGSTYPAGRRGEPTGRVEGGISVHPYDTDVVLWWTSPVDGTVGVSGRLWDAEASSRIRVATGTSLLLVVGGSGDPDYDLTNVDLRIQLSG